MILSRPTLAVFVLTTALAACKPTGEPATTTAPAPAATRTSPPAAPTASPPAPATANAVPAAFLGEWNSDPVDCGSSRNDSRLVIERKRISWWESSGPVTGVTEHGPRDIVVTAELSGEGETWTSTTRFVLGADDTLAATDTSGGTLIRHRCPA